MMEKRASHLIPLSRHHSVYPVGIQNCHELVILCFPFFSILNGSIYCSESAPILVLYDGCMWKQIICHCCSGSRRARTDGETDLEPRI